MKSRAHLKNENVEKQIISFRAEQEKDDLQKYGKYGLDLIKLNERVVIIILIVNFILIDSKNSRTEWRRRRSSTKSVRISWRPG